MYIIKEIATPANEERRFELSEIEKTKDVNGNEVSIKRTLGEIYLRDLYDEKEQMEKRKVSIEERISMIDTKIDEIATFANKNKHLIKE